METEEKLIFTSNASLITHLLRWLEVWTKVHGTYKQNRRRRRRIKITTK